MNKTHLTYSEYWRLYKASRLKRYSHLESWKELFIFQIQYADPKQAKEIAAFAARKNNGEEITLPLNTHVAQMQLII